MKQSRDEILVSPYLVLGIGILAVSTASIFIRYAQQMAPSLAIGAFRLLIAAAILAPFALSKNLPEVKQFDRKKWLLTILAGSFLALHFAAWITSLEYTSVASSVVLVTTAPLWVAIFLTDRSQGENFQVDIDRDCCRANRQPYRDCGQLLSNLRQPDYLRWIQSILNDSRALLVISWRC